MCGDRSSNRDANSAVEEPNPAGSEYEDEASVDNKYVASSEDWEREREFNADQLDGCENRVVSNDDNDVQHVKQNTSFLRCLCIAAYLAFWIKHEVASLGAYQAQTEVLLS